MIRLAETNRDKFKSFITLTYSVDVTEAENSKYLNLLFSKLRQKNKDLSYIWTIERTKKDRIHVHMLTSLEYLECNSAGRKSNAHKLAEQGFEKLWSYKGNVLGWVDIRSLNKGDLTKYSLYIAKYISKAMTGVVAENKHIYGYSKRTLEKPVQERYLTDETLENILKKYTDYEVRYSGNYKIEYSASEDITVSYFNMYLKEK